MGVYTKKGDKGETGLFSSDKNKKRRISKDSARIEAIGAMDEFNSYLGVSLNYCQDKHLKEFIVDIQKDVFTINSILAGADLKFNADQRTRELEEKIDEIEEMVPELKNFLLPSGTKFATHLMYARSMCRRAERRIVSLSSKEKVDASVVKYINRLSDMIFMLFRFANFRAGVGEIVWKTSK